MSRPSDGLRWLDTTWIDHNVWMTCYVWDSLMPQSLTRCGKKAIVTLSNVRLVCHPSHQMSGSCLGLSLNKKHYINKQDSSVDADDRALSKGGKSSSFRLFDYKSVYPAIDWLFSVSTPFCRTWLMIHLRFNDTTALCIISKNLAELPSDQALCVFHRWRLWQETERSRQSVTVSPL